MEMPFLLQVLKIADMGCLSGEWEETEFNIFF